MDKRKITDEQFFEVLEMGHASLCSALTKKAQHAKITVLHCEGYTDTMQRAMYRVLYLREPYVLPGEQSALNL